ncbi:MAG: ATP-binding protein [Patescibacteria group bacterium]|nr:ATP-binding protein [Patescibacteria group bacterium]
MKKTKTPVKRGRPSKTDIEARIKAAQDTNETPAERVARIAERFNVMWKLTKGAIKGDVRSLILSGAPGVGKSHTIVSLLEEAKDKGTIKYGAVSGVGSALGLYKQMYKYSEKNNILLLDDADALYDDEASISLLKAGLDTTHRRTISWLSESNVLKSEDIPDNFVYEGSMIFITNKDFQTIIDIGSGRLVPHFQALMNRSIYLDLKLHSDKDLIAWIEFMILKNHILVQRDLTHDEEKLAVEWLKKHYTEVRSLSIRTALFLADFIKSDPKGWDSIAKVTLLR